MSGPHPLSTRYTNRLNPGNDKSPHNVTQSTVYRRVSYIGVWKDNRFRGYLLTPRDPDLIKPQTQVQFHHSTSRERFYHSSHLI